jgi:hypothetical protein
MNKNQVRLTVAGMTALSVLAVSAPATAGVAAQRSEGTSLSASHKSGKPLKADNGKHGSAKVAKAKQMALRDLDRMEMRLDKSVKQSRVAKLGAEDREALLANVEADKAALGAYAERIEAASTRSDLKSVSKDLKSVRAENYRLAVNLMRQAEQVAAAIAAAQANPDNDQATQDALAQAAALIESVREMLRLITSATAKDEIKSVKNDLSEGASHVDDDDEDEDDDEDDEDDDEDDEDDDEDDEDEEDEDEDDDDEPSMP